MKLYILVTDFGGDNTRWTTGFTTDREVALNWKKRTQEHENAAARDGFRGERKFVVRTGGELPDEGPTAAVTVPGTGAGKARVFAVEAEELE